MDARCAKHQFEGADNFCRQCGHPFCVRCLVYPFGERKPPYCIPCALVASGVRSGGRKAPRASWKDRRAHKKAASQAVAPAAATSLDDPGREAGPIDEPATVSVTEADWSQSLSDDDPWFTSGDQHESWTSEPLHPTPPLHGDSQPWSSSPTGERSFG